SEEHTSELQSLTNLVCRLLLEKKKGQIGHKARSVAALAQLLDMTWRSDPYTPVAVLDAGPRTPAYTPRLDCYGRMLQTVQLSCSSTHSCELRPNRPAQQRTACPIASTQPIREFRRPSTSHTPVPPHPSVPFSSQASHRFFFF